MNKINRLKRNEDFNLIIKKGRKTKNSHFIVYFLPSLVENSNSFRIGISVGKKYGNAPERNYQKRIVRSIITQNEEKILKYDYVIISRPLCKKSTFKMQEKKLLQLFKEL